MNKIPLNTILIALFIISIYYGAFAQPVSLEEAGLEPVTDTIIVHDLP